MTRQDAVREELLETAKILAQKARDLASERSMSQPSRPQDAAALGQAAAALFTAATAPTATEAQP
jgi:hypothetical protein